MKTCDLSNLKSGDTVTVTTRSESETEALGGEFARMLPQNRGFVALSGELGAGKTAFVRGMASVLSPGSAVRSPTYTVVNEYRRGTSPMYHFDLYRITDEDDLYSVGFGDYVDEIGSAAGCVCVAEWSEHAGGELPVPRYSVSIAKTSETSREFTFKYIES